MNVEDVKDFLDSSDEGRALVEELKAPLVKKRDELLAELKQIRDEHSKATEQLNELSSKRTEDTEAIRHLAIDRELSRALDDVRVLPAHKQALLAHLKDGRHFELVANGAQREARIQTGENETISIAEHVKAWAQTEEAQHYIMAPKHTGGGARGSMGVPSQTSDFARRLREAM